MTNDKGKAAENRKRQKLRYKTLSNEIERILFKHDPIGIAYVDNEFVADNPDEYAPEVGTIIPRLVTANSADDIAKIVHEEFVRWFDFAGPKSKYNALSFEIWEAWQRFESKQE